MSGEENIIFCLSKCILEVEFLSSYDQDAHIRNVVQKVRHKALALAKIFPLTRD